MFYPCQHCHQALLVIRMGYTVDQRVFFSENIRRLYRHFRKTLGRMWCPWWRRHAAGVICFHKEFKCCKPSLIVSLRRLDRLFRKTMCNYYRYNYESSQATEIALPRVLYHFYFHFVKCIPKYISSNSHASYWDMRQVQRFERWAIYEMFHKLRLELHVT
jgi:hypothetical protein